MIERMLKTTVICRIEDRESTLDSLRSLGILHVELTSKKESPNQAAITQDLGKTRQILSILDEFKPIKKSTHKDSTPEQVAKSALKLFKENADLKKEIENSRQKKELLLPWGNFSFESLSKLKEKDLFVYLCETDKDHLSNYSDKGSIEVISTNRANVSFTIISTEEHDKGSLPLAQLPPDNISLKELELQISEFEKKLKENERFLSILAAEKAKIKEYILELSDELEFVTNKKGMEHDYVLCYIKGYTPIKKQNLITKASKKYGWALLLQEPSKEDNPPTLITIPKMFRLISPVFEFIGISPGYREWDVSICFLFFFTIFFAMIVGDAGYGVLFLFIAIILKIHFRNKEKFRSPINLFLLLSIATITWGALTCTYFGLPQELFPRKLQGIKALTDPSIKNSNIQLICFILAALQLSFARLWKAVIMRNSLRALGQIGWAMFIWGNFFTAIKLIVFSNMTYPTFAYYLYIIGFFLIIIFYVKWNDVGSIFNTPFDFIGSFSDVLSYIRLFAVGLASFYIASSFNDMAHMVFQLSPYLIVFTIIILLFGHLLNIALAFMGVLVHGIRLNTLEFSNQMELEWAGVVYKPFKKQSKNDEDEVTEDEVTEEELLKA